MSPQPDPSLHDSALEVMSFWAKAAGAALIVWQLVERVWKPYSEWKRKRFAASIREVLKDDLACLPRIQEFEERTNVLLAEVLRRQEQIFADVDDFLSLAMENSERHDETAELLNAAGYASKERRANPEERRARFDSMVDALRMRQRERQREVNEARLLIDRLAPKPPQSGRAD